MTKQLQSILEELKELDINSDSRSSILQCSEDGYCYGIEDAIKVLQKHLSLPKQEKVCDACYGKGKYSVYKGDAVAGVDFPGDKPFVVEQGGVKEFPCPKCKGKQEQEDTTPIEELKKEIEQAQRNGEIRTAIWAIYDSLISNQTNE